MPDSSHSLRLYLVRHGEVEANRTFSFVGRSDEPLTEDGERQARHLGAVFGEIPVERLVSSPLARCMATARSISETTGCPVLPDNRIIEQSYGDWEGLSSPEIESLGAADSELFRAWREDPASAPPGGEALVVVERRALGLVQELSEVGLRDVVIVSHVGPIKALICSGLGLALSQVGRFFLDPASISVVDWRPSPTLRALNVQSVTRWQRDRWLDSL